MSKQTITVERLIDAPVAKVWKAISDKDEMQKWYFDLPDFEPKKGLEFQFMGGEENGIQYLHLCEITEVDEEKKLSYSWSYEDYEGFSYVSFDLEKKDDKTLLTLTHQGIESFPEDNPDFAMDKLKAGWDQLINISLVNYFENKNRK